MRIVRLCTVLTLLFLVGALVAQSSPARKAEAPAHQNQLVSADGKFSWWAHAKDPNVMMLYYRASDGQDHLCGVLDPEAGSWRWRYDAKPMDMIAATTGQGRNSGTGALPPAGKSALKAGVKEDSADPAAKIGDKSECKCGDGCECMDGHVGIDCRCPKGTCKCALVNKSPRLKGNDGTPDVRDSDKGKPGIDEHGRGGPDARQVVDGDITAEPRVMLKLAASGVIHDPNPRPAGVTRFTLADSRGAHDATPAEAMSAIESMPANAGGGGGTIPNDGCLPVITVIGEKSVRDPILGDFDQNPALASFKGRVRVQGEEPGTWRAGSERGFVQPKPGGVVIYATDCDGKVLWRQDDYAGGAETYAGRLRDAIPGYNPARDPGPGRGGDVSAESLAWWLIPATIAGGIGLCVLIFLVVIVFRSLP